MLVGLRRLLEPSDFIPISNYPTKDWKNPAKPNDGIFEVGKILGRQYGSLQLAL